MYFFTDPDAWYAREEDLPPVEARPFPYERCEKVRVRDLTLASGKEPQISPNEDLEQTIDVVEEA
jgi:hypothetical protein